MYKQLRIIVLSVLLIGCSQRHYHSLPPEDSKLEKIEDKQAGSRFVYYGVTALLIFFTTLR